MDAVVVASLRGRLVEAGVFSEGRQAARCSRCVVFSSTEKLVLLSLRTGRSSWTVGRVLPPVYGLVLEDSHQKRPRADRIYSSASVRSRLLGLGLGDLVGASFVFLFFLRWRECLSDNICGKGLAPPASAALPIGEDVTVNLSSAERSADSTFISAEVRFSQLAGDCWPAVCDAHKLKKKNNNTGCLSSVSALAFQTTQGAASAAGTAVLQEIQNCFTRSQNANIDWLRPQLGKHSKRGNRG